MKFKPKNWGNSKMISHAHNSEQMEATGLEPVTGRLWADYSDQLSYTSTDSIRNPPYYIHNKTIKKGLKYYNMKKYLRNKPLSFKTKKNLIIIYSTTYHLLHLYCIMDFCLFDTLFFTPLRKSFQRFLSYMGRFHRPHQW